MKTINGKKMKELLEKNQANTIDVDPVSEYQKNHLTGSINIPYSEENFTQKVQQEFARKNENVVLCANRQLGPQLSKLGKELEGAGYKNVYQYKAGPSEWEDSSLSIQKQS